MRSVEFPVDEVISALVTLIESTISGVKFPSFGVAGVEFNPAEPNIDVYSELSIMVVVLFVVCLVQCTVVCFGLLVQRMLLRDLIRHVD